MGGSFGKSKNEANNSFNQNVWGPQGNALQQLYQAAFGQLNSGSGTTDKINGSADWASNALQNLFGNASNQQNNLAGGGAFGNPEEIRNKLFGSMGGPSQTGQMYESIIGGRGNEYIDPVIDQLKQSAAQNVQTLQGQNAADAALMGQSGSSRQAMENAMITSQANKDLLSQESQLRAGAYDKDLAMKMGIAQMADGNKQAEQDRLFNMLSGAQNSMNTGFQGNQMLQALALGSMAPYLQAQQSQWNPLMNLANIIGGPTILGQGGGSSSGKGKGGSASLFG